MTGVAILMPEPIMVLFVVYTFLDLVLSLRLEVLAVEGLLLNLSPHASSKYPKSLGGLYWPGPGVHNFYSYLMLQSVEALWYLLVP